VHGALVGGSASITKISALELLVRNATKKRGNATDWRVRRRGWNKGEKKEKGEKK
jgi:hypothetical protein